ncbi:YhgE/Pip domain-containing protein [Paraliobacillus salinarum]|uniref:YhgE/Pip domain-containing protein n=1 Tax=Paraliobacillus salinarum TaxID=1158996 RepID=UPI0015F4221B|nr:YhgE/Pip domain-containing protein [Paraliobacillus salinarum]
MKTRKLFLLTMILMLVFPSVITHAENNDGEVVAKEEVVYATLGAEGMLTDIYVVNILDVTNPGQIIDYGKYTSVKNLTTVSPIEQKEDEIIIEPSEKGEFYYQGNMANQALPWDVQIDYRLDGKKISPKQLAGQSGHLEMKIKTSQNEAVDKSFFENYLLQISATAGSDVFKHVQAADASIANAGEDLVVNWTVMPEKKGDFTLEADVTNFEMQGIEIAALPSSMPIESPDTEALTSDFESLHNAISEINNGVGELENGISGLNSGVGELKNGSASFQGGLNEAAGSSSSLVNASDTIGQSLEKISESIGNSAEAPDLSELSQLQEGLNQIAKGLEDASDGLSNLNKGFTEANNGLKQVMQGLPNPPASDEALQAKVAEMKAVVDAFADDDPKKQTAVEMMKTYQAAIQAKGAYNQAKEVFNAVGPALTATGESLITMSGQLSTMASELGGALESMDIGNSFAQLEQGLTQLANNYGDFHAGLVEYTGGVEQLSDSYAGINQGISELTNGTNELATGAGELHNGTKELETSTADLPNEIKEQIDAMLAQYDKSDYEPVSFVSKENKDVERVQFVIRTENIEQQEDEASSDTEQQPKQQKNLWDKIIDLFK